MRVIENEDICAMFARTKTVTTEETLNMLVEILNAMQSYWTSEIFATNGSQQVEIHEVDEVERERDRAVNARHTTHADAHDKRRSRPMTSHNFICRLFRFFRVARTSTIILLK